MGALVIEIIEAMNIKVKINMKEKPQLRLFGNIMYALTKNPMIENAMKEALSGFGCHPHFFSNEGSCLEAFETVLVDFWVVFFDFECVTMVSPLLD